MTSCLMFRGHNQLKPSDKEYDRFLADGLQTELSIQLATQQTNFQAQSLIPNFRNKSFCPAHLIQFNNWTFSEPIAFPIFSNFL